MLQLTVSNAKPIAINSTVIFDIVFMAPSLQDQEITDRSRVLHQSAIVAFLPALVDRLTVASVLHDFHDLSEYEASSR
jgi:hypothetical protein